MAQTRHVMPIKPFSLTTIAPAPRSLAGMSALLQITSLLEENLQEEPSNDKYLRLWVQAVRWSKYPPSIESVIERVSYWKANSGTLDSVYYLYLLYVLSALQGSAQAKHIPSKSNAVSLHSMFYRKYISVAVQPSKSFVSCCTSLATTLWGMISAVFSLILGNRTLLSPILSILRVYQSSVAKYLRL